MSVHKIYALICPFENRVVYVGQTRRTIKERMAGHSIWIKTTNTNYYNWLVRMRQAGVTPGYIILEYDPINPNERERYWIWLFGIGNLYNKSMGTDGFRIAQINEYKRIEKKQIQL